MRKGDRERERETKTFDCRGERDGESGGVRVAVLADDILCYQFFLPILADEKKSRTSMKAIWYNPLSCWRFFSRDGHGVRSGNTGLSSTKDRLIMHPELSLLTPLIPPSHTHGWRIHQVHCAALPLVLVVVLWMNKIFDIGRPRNLFLFIFISHFSSSFTAWLETRLTHTRKRRRNLFSQTATLSFPPLPPSSFLREERRGKKPQF